MGERREEGFGGITPACNDTISRIGKEMAVTIPPEANDDPL